jgi:HEAT repeat protein
MIKKISLFMLAAGCWCALSAQPIVLSVDDLLKNLPAQNQVQNTLLAEALLNQDAATLAKIIRQLDGDDIAAVQTAHYALDAMALYAAQLDAKDSRRLTLLTAVANSLTQKHSLLNQAFLITLLQHCPDPGMIAWLNPFLTEENLCEPAAAALYQLASPAAGKALTNALALGNDRTREILINMLGQMHYNPAAPVLLKIAQEKNETLTQAALSALAALGWEQAEPLLHQNALLDDINLSTYMLYAKTTADKAKAALICRAIFNNKEKTWPDPDRINALYTLVQRAGAEALPDLYKAVLNEKKTIRMAALRLAEPICSLAEIEKWTALLPVASPEIQADILEMLGRQKANTAVPLMRSLSSSADSVVRLAAGRALTLTRGKEATADLLAQLSKTPDEAEQQQIKQNLLLLPNSTLVIERSRCYPDLPPSAKKILLEIGISRQDSTVIPVLLSSLSAADAALRITGLEGLKTMGALTALPELLVCLSRSVEPSETRAVQNGIIEIVKKSRDRKQALQQLDEYINTAALEQKKNILRIWRGIGGESCLQKVQALGQRPECRDESLRTLCDWPDLSAMEPLLQLAGSKTEQHYCILAIRGALRILRENTSADLRQLQYLQQIMTVCDRPEEKRMVLAQVGNSKSVSAIKYAAGFCSDPAIGYEAAMAVVSIAAPDQEGKAVISANEAAAAILQAQANTALQKQIMESPLLKTSLNQPPEDFVALFNGKDLTGWKGLVADPVQRSKMNAVELVQAQSKADEEMRQHWQVMDGVLCFDGQGHSLCTGRDYSDFEMYVDWKIEKLGDSGIYLRGAPQVQIWDPAQWPEGSGGLYNNQKNPAQPLVKADNPIGEWNTFHIVMRDQRVTVYLNETLVVDHVIMENYWERDKPIYRSGQIELQSHNSPLYFRNIFIKELPEEKPAFNGPLFNGIDLAGWQVINGKPESWGAAEGILFTTGQGGGWLSTLQQFQDFKLALEFRVPAGGNSGVFIRSPHQGDPAYTGMEIQVLDDYAEQYAKLHPWQYTGSVYGVQAPSQRVSKQFGQWQTMVITCLGPHVTVELNGVKTIDTNLIEHMEKSKDHPGITRRGGYIGLQNHSSRLEYRNIRLQELR